MLDAQEFSQAAAAAPIEFELFASDEQLALLEARHAKAPQEPALALAWALRQREPERALELARALADEPWAQPRLWLIEGERALANEQVDGAQAWCERALRGFERNEDEIGLCDTEMLRALIVSERSLTGEERDACESALVWAERAKEPGRRILILFYLARMEALSKGLEREAYWHGQLPGEVSVPALASAQAEYRAAIHMRRNESAAAATQYAEAYAQSLRSGQGWRAAQQSYNAAYVWDEAGDADNALVWAQRSLALARRVCPAMIGPGVLRCGAILRGLGQLTEARDMIVEAVRLANRQPESVMNILALGELGRLEETCGNDEAAVNFFSAALASPNIWPPMRVELIQQRSAALLKLGRLEEAEASVNEGLRLDPTTFLGPARLVMRATQADIWLADGRPQVAAQAYAEILADAGALPGYVMDGSLLAGAARARAAIDDFASAYALSKRASDAHQSRHSGEAEQRARAMYTQQRVERVQLETEHQRSLAKAAAGRLAVLEQLGDTGRALTAELDADRALALMAQHIHALLPLQSLSVHLLDASGERLQGVLRLEQGGAVPPVTLSLDPSRSAIARCAADRQMAVLQAGPDLAPKMRSMVVAPLEIGARLVGVMCAQSQGSEVFGPEQQLIFKTLCAYLAVALDNARAYAQLQQVQRHVQAQERMAALGSLVAGVSHELNTPIGNALMSSSTLSVALRDFETKLEGGALRRSDLTSFGAQLREGLELIDHGVQRAAQLINNFKQVAQDRNQQHRSHFKLRELRELCEMMLLQRRVELEPAGHTLRIDIDADLELDSYAGSLAQALSVLLANAVQHGLSLDHPGCIDISAQLLPLGRVALSVQDDGPGMSPAVLERAFEPFFTTTFGRGGNGLGLSICHNIVADVLGGEVRASSEPGQGACFTIEMPISAV